MYIYVPGVPEKMLLSKKSAYLTKEHFLGHPVYKTKGSTTPPVIFFNFNFFSDTPEVKQAKEEFFKTFSKVCDEHGRSFTRLTPINFNDKNREH